MTRFSYKASFRWLFKWQKNNCNIFTKDISMFVFSTCLFNNLVQYYVNTSLNPEHENQWDMSSRACYRIAAGHWQQSSSSSQSSASCFPGRFPILPRVAPVTFSTTLRLVQVAITVLSEHRVWAPSTAETSNLIRKGS